MFKSNTDVNKEIDLEIETYHLGFLVQGLKQIYPGAEEAKLQRVGRALISVSTLPADIDVDNLTEEQQKIAVENSAAFDDLEASLGMVNLSEEESDRLSDLVDDLLQESIEEVQRYCIDKAAGLMFGPSEPGNVVVGMGFGGPMFEGLNK